MSNRTICCLPKNLKSLCEMGCIYREKAFKQIGCPLAQKRKDSCVAPCSQEFCECWPPSKTEIREIVKKERNEVFLL